MKNKLLLSILLVSLLGCNTHNTETEQPESVLSVASANPAAQVAMTGENVEYLDRRSVRINGKFPLATTVQNINGLLGKPDSVKTIDWDETCSSDFRSENSKLAYYSGYQFEQFGDSLDLQSVDFRKSKVLFLQSNDLQLNSSTTLEEIKMRFPNAAKSIDKMDVYELGKVDAIVLPPSKGLSDGHWLLMFQNGKLIRIDDWFPC